MRRAARRVLRALAARRAHQRERDVPAERLLAERPGRARAVQLEREARHVVEQRLGRLRLVHAEHLGGVARARAETDVREKGARPGARRARARSLSRARAREPPPPPRLDIREHALALRQATDASNHPVVFSSSAVTRPWPPRAAARARGGRAAASADAAASAGAAFDQPRGGAAGRAVRDRELTASSGTAAEHATRTARPGDARSRPIARDPRSHSRWAAFLDVAQFRLLALRARR